MNALYEKIDRLKKVNEELLEACKRAESYCLLPFNLIDGAKAQAVVNVLRAAIKAEGRTP